MKSDLRKFFYPESVCVVGASSKEKSIGYEILKSIKTYSYNGSVFPVNPKADKILDFNCYGSILDIRESIDLAIIVLPKKFVNESVDQLIIKNVKAIVLITAGYRETGELGKKQELLLLNKLRANNIRMIGPNCMGLINTLNEVKLNATFVAEKPMRGGIAFLSQSGALGAAVLNSLREADIRFAHFISVGNKADVSELDVLDFWIKDPNIKTMTFYLESFEDGLKLVDRYKNGNSRKPLIILKAGKTKSGMKAASSHTGALSSNEKIVDAILKQFGIIRAVTINEMFNTAKGFESFPIPKGKKIAVVTNAGGPAILAVDKLEEKQLELASLSEVTKKKLREIVHPEGSVNNPIDLLPGGSPEIYKSVNETVLDDENVDAVISIFVEPVMVNAFSVIEAVNEISSSKPVYQVCMPLPEFWEKYKTDSKYSRPIFRTPEDPAEVISNILFYEETKNKKITLINNENTNDSSKIAEFLNPNQIKELCTNFSIPIIEERIIQIDSVGSHNDFSYPVVAKGLSKDVVHKSELNAVKLNIKTIEELVEVIKEIEASFMLNNLKLEEIMIQPYITQKHELLIGGFRDPSFGPTIMFGSGGKYVEILEDTKIKSAYVNDEDLNDIISGTKIGQIINGVRGEEGVEINKLKSIIKSVANLMIQNEKIQEIDLNPLIVDDQNNLYAVDVRIKAFK